MCSHTYWTIGFDSQHTLSKLNCVVDHTYNWLGIFLAYISMTFFTLGVLSISNGIPCHLYWSHDHLRHAQMESNDRHQSKCIATIKWTMSIELSVAIEHLNKSLREFVPCWLRELLSLSSSHYLKIVECISQQHVVHLC